MLIACDVDEVCAAMLAEWVRRYNIRWNDTLKMEDIKGWDMREYVKPSCGSKVYDILHDGNIYESVRPIPGARQAVVNLRMLGHRVVFVTSCVRGFMDHKLNWLIQWGFLPDRNAHPDFIAAADKHLIRADLLIDDRLENVEDFPGHALLVDMPHNQAPSTRPRIAYLGQAPGHPLLRTLVPVERCV